MPNCFTYNETLLQGSKLHHRLGKLGTKKERLQLFKLATLCKHEPFIADHVFQQALAEALNYLCDALNDQENAAFYHAIIDALYKALTDEAYDKAILSCDFRKLPATDYSKIVHDKVLEHVAAIVRSMDEPLSCEQKTVLHNALQGLNSVWRKALRGNKNAQFCLQHATPTTALYTKILLDELYAPHAAVTREVMEEHVKKTGLDTVVTSHAGTVSNRELERYQMRATQLSHSEEVPHMGNIRQMLHDAYTPKKVVVLVRDALEFWHEGRTRTDREIAVCALTCGAISYNYYKEGVDELGDCILDIGRGILTVGKVVAKVTWSKAKNITCLADKSLDFTAKSLMQVAHQVVDNVNRFVNFISGKGFYIPEDYFHEQELLENIKRKKEYIGFDPDDIKRYVKGFGHGLYRSTSFLAYLAGVSARDVEKMNEETAALLIEFINKKGEEISKFSKEKTFEVSFDFALDCVVFNQFFTVGSLLFEQLKFCSHEIVELRKLATATIREAVPELEALRNLIKKPKIALVNATNESLIPYILESQSSVPIKGGIKAPSKAVAAATSPSAEALKEFTLALADLELKYGKNVINEVVRMLQWDNTPIFNQYYNFRKCYNALSMQEYIEKIAKEIAMIDSVPNRYLYRLEADGISRLKNVKEAKAAIACQEQGLLQNLVRDQREGMGDFIDIVKGQTWDVKTAESYALSGQPIFQHKYEVDAFIESLARELDKPTNEYLIISIGELEESSHKILYEALEKKFSKIELQRMLIADELNPKNSKSTAELIKFLGKDN